MVGNAERPDWKIGINRVPRQTSSIQTVGGGLRLFSKATKLGADKVAHVMIWGENGQPLLNCPVIEIGNSLFYEFNKEVVDLFQRLPYCTVSIFDLLQLIRELEGKHV